MNKNTLFLFMLMAFSLPLALSGQTYFTQTTSSDFMKGTGTNTIIANDCVSLQYKMASVADWSATTNLPQTLENHQVVTWRNYVYCVGGYNGSNPVNNVYRATQQDNGISSWTSLNALPVALKDMAVVATQTHLIVIGGRNAAGIKDKIYVAKFNDDGSIGSWTESSHSLPEPRWGMRAVVVHDNIYLIGGATDDTLNIATNTVYRMSLNTVGLFDTIVPVGNLPAPRNGHAVAVYDSKIIVTGGYDASQTPQSTVYGATVNLNGGLGSWATMAPLTEAVYDHTTVCANGILTVIGGHNGSLPSNKFYYADADATTYNWILSDVMMPERYFRCASFAFGNKIFLCGGEATSGTVNNLVSYMAVTSSEEPVKKSAFIGIPYYIGTPKTLQEFNYTLTNPTSKTYEILYRTAGEDKVFSNWTSAGSTLPAVVNQSKSYIQYMFRITATGENDFSIDDVTLTVTGYKQLTGNLNDLGDLTLEDSPYLVTGDISFTSGTHNIEAGVTIMFMPNTGLNIGQASVNFNGTQANPILLTAYESAAGSWNGVYFQDASDNGVTSVMNYTTIEKAGNGSNAANLRLYYTNQPTMNHCTIKNSIGDGAYFQNSSPTLTYCTFTESPENRSGLALINSSPELTSCTISNNNYQGLHLNNSAPTCNNCTMTENMYGIYFQTTNFNATFNGVTSSNNQYGMYSCSPNRSFIFDNSSVAFSNNTADIAVAGGQISSDQTWNNYPNGYALLGNVEVYGGTPKLTVQPGTTIKGNVGCGLYVGRNNNQGGMLYAVGTTSQPITFTSLNGEVGGWDGIRFRDGSDYSSSSSMRRCVVEKGVHNLVCSSTNQPSVMWCTFQNAQNHNVDLTSANISIEGSTLKDAPIGLWVSSSAPTVVSVVFENHSEACVYHNNECSVTYSDCTMKDSQYGIRYWTCNKDMVNNDNVTFENNVANIAVPGGTIGANCTWASNTYAILDNINVYTGGYYYSGSPSRLTISPGCTLKFAEGKRMQISHQDGSYYYFGELNAIGTEDQPITFTSMNGEIGGWNGIYFHDYSDNTANQESVLKHCIMENGNEYNLHLSSTNQPSIIEGCTFRNSAGRGVYLYNSYDTIRNCQFENNVDYGLYYNNPHYVGTLENLTFMGNMYDGVVMGGGTISTNRIWNKFAENATYFILDNINVYTGGYYYSGSPSRLTISPGCTLKFAEGKRMQISHQDGSYYYFGELNAIGTEDQPITFTSMNGEIGGWNGIYFHDYSDNTANQESVLKHCIMENGNEYNLHLSSTSQPSIIENCTFQNANGYGVYFYGSSPSVSHCVIRDNGTHGIYLNNNSNPIVGRSPENANNIYNNNGYAVYQNGTNNIDMSYNFWGEIGSKAIDDNLIYDNMDNSSKGRITFEPVSWFPAENFSHLQGTFTYNDTKLMANREMNVISVNDSLLATTTTNGNGQYDFSNYQVGVYNTLADDFGVDILAGVNATDALLVMRHFVHLDTLVNAQAAAADVNQSGSINGTDAMLIMRRAVGETFSSGDFYYYNPTSLNISGDTCHYDLSFLCFGDVNGSYTPQNRDNSMELLHEGQLLADSHQEMEVPVSIKQAVDLGALTLHFNYPEEYLEIEDVVLAATGESLLFTASEGEMRIVWFSLETLALAEDDGLIVIKVRTKDLSDIDEPVAFSLGVYSELADGSAQVIEGVVIAMPDIVTETMGVGEDTTTDGLTLSFYPNPANDVCTMVYQLPEAGRMTVSIYDLMGVKVMDAADCHQEGGRHELRLSTASLAAGMYCCRITFEGEGSWVKTTMLIIEK